MPRARLFLDSSALFAGIISADGAARALLLLGELGQIDLLISEQVLAETERAVARKVPAALPALREAIRLSGAQILRDPPPADVHAAAGWISHPPDVPILVAARLAQVDFLVTLNRRHFLADPRVAARSGLRLGTPGDALAWVRERLATDAAPSP